MKVTDLIIYLKVFGLANGGEGNPTYAGMKINLGKLKEPMDYEELLNGIYTKGILSELPGFSKYADIAEVITPEEYFRDYHDKEDDSIE